MKNLLIAVVGASVSFALMACTDYQGDYSDKYDVWHPVCKVTEISGCEAPEEKIINVT